MLLLRVWIGSVADLLNALSWAWSWDQGLLPVHLESDGHCELMLAFAADEVITQIGTALLEVARWRGDLVCTNEFTRYERVMSMKIMNRGALNELFLHTGMFLLATDAPGGYVADLLRLPEVKHVAVLATSTAEVEHVLTTIAHCMSSTTTHLEDRILDDLMTALLAL